MSTILWISLLYRLPVHFLQSWLVDLFLFGLSLFFVMIQMLLIFILFTSVCFGIKICENGLFCVSDENCQIGNQCMDFVDGKTKSTRCVPREDLGDTYNCSLSQKSCECE